MKIENYKYPESSFLSSEKDLEIIVNYLFKNENLKKLLYYNSKDCLKKPKVSDEKLVEMFGKNIKIVPKLTVDNDVLTYIVVSFDSFTPSDNPEFRDNIIEFDIICHFDQWLLDDMKLRPMRIAAEIDTMINNKRLTGIGKVDFLGASQIILTEEFGGLCLLYQTVHGEEDKKKMPNPNDEQNMISNFDNIFNVKEYYGYQTSFNVRDRYTHC